MAEEKLIKSVKISMVVEGDESFSSTFEFTNTKLSVVLLQQKALLEAELALVNSQLTGKPGTI